MCNIVCTVTRANSFTKRLITICVTECQQALTQDQNIQDPTLSLSLSQCQNTVIDDLKMLKNVQNEKLHAYIYMVVNIQ